MSQRAFQTFRKLMWLAIAVFWMFVFSSRVHIGNIFVDLTYCLTFTVGTMLMFQGLTVFMYIIKESDESLENHDKIYKALEQLEDIEDS